METKLLTVEEVALALRVSPRTVRSWILQRSIDYVKLGPGLRAAVRIEKSELIRILRDGMHRARQRRGEGCPPGRPRKALAAELEPVVALLAAEN